MMPPSTRSLMVIIHNRTHFTWTHTHTHTQELLIATRHILATDFKTGFITQIDTLLEESVLIGNGRTAFETLRPLAYTTLFDLIHHARNQLSLTQLSKVVRLYTANLHDSSLPFGIHTMSAKLLWHLFESILKARDLPEPAVPSIAYSQEIELRRTYLPRTTTALARYYSLWLTSHPYVPNHWIDDTGRGLFIRMLVAFANKLHSLKYQIPKLVASNVDGSSIDQLKGTYNHSYPWCL